MAKHAQKNIHRFLQGLITPYGMDSARKQHPMALVVLQLMCTGWHTSAAQSCQHCGRCASMLIDTAALRVECSIPSTLLCHTSNCCGV